MKRILVAGATGYLGGFVARECKSRGYRVRALTRSRRLVGADVVEVAPRPGDARTEYGAAQLIYSLIGLALGSR